MFGDLLRHLRSAVSTIPPEEVRRFKLIQDWIVRLSVEDARQLACRVLDNPAWFHTRRGDSSGMVPVQAPAAVREFYSLYVSAIGRFCDMHLIASDCRASTVRPDLLRVGRNDEHVELCTRGTDNQVYLVASDVGKDEAIEGSVPSLYHAVVRTAAVLEYVPVPAPA